MKILVIIAVLFVILIVIMMFLGRRQAKIMDEYQSMTPQERKLEQERLEKKLYNHFLAIGETESAHKVQNKEYEYRHLKMFERYYKL